MLLALLALPAGAAAQERMRAGDFRAMPPQKIADAILPAGHAPIAGVAFDRMGPFTPPPPFVATIRSMRFYSVSAPISADFCAQDEIGAEITPMPEADDAWLESPPRLLRETPGRRLYRYRVPGAACDGTAPHFAIYGMPAQQGLDAFRALVGAARLAEARTRKPLPFTISCQAMQCGGPRAAMRALPYGEILSIQPLLPAQLAGRDRLSRLGRLPGRVAIAFGLPLWGTRRIDISAILHRGRIEHVAISESFVVF